MIDIDPKHSFPNEPQLPEHWTSPLHEMQEHELEHRWSPSPRYPETDYHSWSTNNPTEAKAWAEAQRSVLRKEREATLSDWLLSVDVARQGGESGKQAFRDNDMNATFNQLHYIASRYKVAPDRNMPSTDAVVAEARRASADPARVVDELKARLWNGDSKAVAALKFSEISAKLDSLAEALRAWSGTLAEEPMPDPKALGELAETCRRRFAEVQDAAIGFSPRSDVTGAEIGFVKEVVRQYVEVLAGVVADQLASRAGEPSFLNLFNRLTERPHGVEVDKAVKSAIKDASGDYRLVWSDGRDDLIDRIKDKAERTALQKALAANKLDLGPNLATWRDQFSKLSKGSSSKTAMRDAVLKLTFAADGYRDVIESVVKQPDVKDGFLQLLDGIQLSISRDVKFCIDEVK